MDQFDTHGVDHLLHLKFTASVSNAVHLPLIMVYVVSKNLSFYMIYNGTPILHRDVIVAHQYYIAHPYHI